MRHLDSGAEVFVKGIAENAKEFRLFPAARARTIATGSRSVVLPDVRACHAAELGVNMLLKRLSIGVASVMLLTAAAVSVKADEPPALCCDFTSECTTTEFPQCNLVGIDCDTNENGHQGYCMKKDTEGN
jgi:hypothetical protein